ncbi:MAG: tol-pal system protein YbgF [Desulfobacteraceae bacterium]|nr:tol-pal system protein YbgF [Desulfobacteraceae bacterium]
MAPIKNFFFKSFLLCLGSIAFCSCSSFDSIKQTVDPVAQTDLARPSTEDENTGYNQHGVAELEEEILLLEKTVSGLENQLSNREPAIYKITYTAPPQLYQKARNLLLEGDFINAAQLFRIFIQQHPKHNLANNSMYWLGECSYSSGQYTEAVTIFKNLVKTYPKGKKVPDALLKTGYSYLSMDDTNRAHHYLKAVLIKYPFSPAAEKAQEKLKEFE